MTKSHDDSMLFPPNLDIGERPCVMGEQCLANQIAKIRFGVETDKCFTCKEFLLPSQKQTFLDGKGLPSRKGKCLLCLRYFQNYTYLVARTDPAFKVGESPLGLQVFCNAVTSMPPPKGVDEAALQEAAARLPTHASAVICKDGYKPEAMLFVDEDWAAFRSAREGSLGNLLWRPAVRFCSTHYQYVKDSHGLRIVQVGIGTDEDSNGLLFQGPSVRKVAAPAAKQREATLQRKR